MFDLLENRIQKRPLGSLNSLKIGYLMEENIKNGYSRWLKAFVVFLCAYLSFYMSCELFEAEVQGIYCLENLPQS